MGDRRIPLSDRRELRVAPWVHGLVTIAVHDIAGGICVSGPLCLRAADVAAVQAALSALALDDAETAA
jgi:hypothetical protein